MTAAKLGAAAVACSLHPCSLLDKALVTQGLAEELLLPTPTNINPIHVPGDDLLHFFRVQQWVHDKLHISLPLLDGMFVLVRSADLQQQQPLSKELQGAGCSSSNAAVHLQSAIPWRLRQVLRVEVATAHPADATVVLVGGDRVATGTVHKVSSLADADDYQYLCCELADLQQRGQLRPLQVFDIAHMAWRLRVACELDCCVESCHLGSQQEALAAASSILRALPQPDWLQQQVIPHVELSPYGNSNSLTQPQQLLSAEQYAQLLQDAAGAWQQFVERKLTGQQPSPAEDLVPWRPLCTDQQCNAAIASPRQPPGGAGTGADGTYTSSLSQQEGCDDKRAANSSYSCSMSISTGPDTYTSGGSSSSSISGSGGPISSQVHPSQQSPSTSTEDGEVGSPGQHTAGNEGRSRSRSRSRSPVGTRGRRGSRIEQQQQRRELARHLGSGNAGARDVEASVRAWLQELAVRVTAMSGPPPPARGGKKPHSVSLDWLCQNHRLPNQIMKHFKSVSRFVDMRPELCWTGSFSSRRVHLDPVYHAQLLQEASDAKAAGLREQPPGSSCRAASAQQQGSRKDRPLPAAAAAAEQKPCSGQDDEIVRGLVRTWLVELAQLLAPLQRAPKRPNSIQFSDLKRRLPIPRAVVEHFGGVFQFINEQPSLTWTSASKRAIALVPLYHERLLERARARGNRR